MFGHSARASEDGMKAYVSYWDLGVLTFDISDPSNPVLLTRTKFEEWEDGDAHSMTPYENKRGKRFILQNDEDLSPRTPAEIRYGRRGEGIGVETPGAPPLWLERKHKVAAPVVMAANQGCAVADYPAGTAGKIAVAYTPFPFFDESGDEPLCLQQEQEAAAEAAGAAALVHDFVAENTTPQWFDFGEVGIPVLFTDHETAQGMVAAGFATLKARKPSWGYLRVYNARSGRQVAKFDDVRNVHTLPAPVGRLDDSQHRGDGRPGVQLLVLERDRRARSQSAGQATSARPAAGRPVRSAGRSEDLPFSGMWGVFIREDGIVFGSDTRQRSLDREAQGEGCSVGNARRACSHGGPASHLLAISFLLYSRHEIARS